jgi:spermidine synthase
MNSPRRLPYAPLIIALFFASGAAGLVYEVIWMQMLAVTLGGTAPAVAAVLAAFMGGLALGSAFGGRLVDRLGRPLLWYAGLELFVGLYALAFPFIYRVVDGLYFGVYEPGATGALHLLRFGVACLILLAPTAAMGATTPAVVAALRAYGGGTSRSFSGAYAANTIGAATGVLLGGFWLLWAAGASLALKVTAAANLTVAIAACAVALRYRADVPTPAAAPADTTRRRAPTWQAAAAAFILGGAALAAQVLWTRALANVVGSATYAFAAMLAVILLAIAAGAAVHRRLGPEVGGSSLFYGGCCLAAAAGLAASVVALRGAPFLFLAAYGGAGGGFGVALVLVFALAVLVLFVPSFFLGIILPVTVAAARRREAGTRVGYLYAANTAGAIVGSLVGTFVLLPRLGPTGGLRAVAILALAAAFVWGVSRRRAMWQAPVAVALAALAVVAPGPSRHTLALGTGISPGYYLDDEGRLELDEAAQEKLIFYEESVDASVAVISYGSIRALKINGKAVASTNYDDVRVERELGELPLREFRDVAANRGRVAEDALIIGLGTGITLGAVAADPALGSVVCVEINPAVPAASRYFDAWSGAPLDDPRVGLIREDGRSYVLGTDKRFDVITSDPIHPWTKGSSSLFTVEHFRNCAGVLKPGGVMAQWLPLYQLAPSDYLTAVRSFADAFEHVRLYYTGRDTVLIGSNSAWFNQKETEPYCIAGDELLRELVADAEPNTEDRLILEYTAPRSLYEKTDVDNLAILASLRDEGGDERYRAVTALIGGRLAYLRGDDDTAAAAYRWGLDFWPENGDLRQGLADVYFDWGLAAWHDGDVERARELFERILELTPDDEAAAANLEALGG